jgi:hypothetical protein
MDWDEIRTRAGQQLHKHADLLRYRMGMRPTAIRLDSSAAPAGRFFFTSAEAAARAELIRQHLPDQAAQLVREADEICRHRFRLLDYENLDYGDGKDNDIDWHLDAVHGKRAPLDPWFEIPFLDFAIVGDHKVIWELNRHQHLATLAKAWLLTKDEKYVHELIAQWRGWIKANPYPLGINWASTLEVAFRSLSWVWVDHLLADAPGYGKFCADLLPALAFHGRYIERHLSTYFSPNTHLLGEVLALFFLGTLYPQIPHARQWKEYGWKILLREAERQARPDGLYFEQSLYYHVYALDFFLHARLLAAANDIQIPTAYDHTLLKMLAVIEALAQAGPAEGFGDDDGGRLFDPRRNRTEHMTDPLAVGALSFDRDDLAAAQLTEESIWLFGARAVTKLAQPKARASFVSSAFADGGLYVLADSDPFPQVMTIDAGPQGVGRSGHGHADALSLRLAMNGSRWLVDSGSGVYVSSDPAERNVFRGTAAHNTMRVDGADQAVADEPFSWTGIPVTRLESWLTGRTFTYFAGSHNGFERLPDPVTHRRSVLRVNGGITGGIWLVRDEALGSAEHDLEVYWHFASDVLLEDSGAGQCVASRADPNQPALCLVSPEDSMWKISLTRGQLSPAYGRFESAPVVRCAARVKLPAKIATVLLAQSVAGQLPQTVAGQRGESARLFGMQEAAVQAYELHDRNEIHGFFFARDKRAWSCGLWSSDAELLYCRTENDKLAHLVVIGGSSLSWQGQALLNANSPLKFFEWRKRDGTLDADPDSFSTTPVFDELAGRSNASPIAPNITSSYAEKH